MKRRINLQERGSNLTARQCDKNDLNFLGTLVCLSSMTYELRPYCFRTLAWNGAAILKPARIGKKMKAVKKYSLCALLAIGLACNANAKPQDQKDKKDKEDKGKQEKVVDALPGAKTDQPFSVPDAGSTAALLGLSVALLVFAQRKAAAIVK